MDEPTYIPRALETPLEKHLKRGKSILLLGPRQVGKSTLLKKIPHDRWIDLIVPRTRQAYERNPSLLIQELESLKEASKKIPLVIIDEIQKVPALMDCLQDLIDRRIAQFLLTGSSARKLRRSEHPNLLPGRIVSLSLYPFSHNEYPEKDVLKIITDGQLPGIVLQKDSEALDEDLRTYVETYLEEEIREEAIVRNVGVFARFLELAALESGKIVSFRSISQELGVSHSTISGYYEILEDCLVIHRIEPYTKKSSRKKLIKSNRYLFFDLGMRRACAREDRRTTPERYGEFFEQWVGLELLKRMELLPGFPKLYFWRDADGPEVDWILEQQKQLIPIEVKWSEKPSSRDIQHMETFLNEYPQAKKGFVICRADQPFKLSARITALPWQKLGNVLTEAL